MQDGEYALDLALQYFGKKGIFPVSGEKTGAFFTRAMHLATQSQVTHLPSSFKKAASKLVREWPHWIIVEKTGEGLAFFERGATFIDEVDPTMPVQIRLKYVRERNRLDKEVWLHELIHALRYKEGERSWFEESIAYFFSPSPFRKWLGATFRRPSHHWLFLLSTLLPPLLLCLVPLPSLTHALALWLPAFTLLLFNMARSIKDTKTLGRCFAFLVDTLGKKRAQTILVKLSDDEIKSLAAQKLSAVGAWLKMQVAQSIKWRQIALLCAPAFLD